ncbi:MAG: hypothetical protein DRI22_02455 [Caldiserica bacterium]|nr:MAG: hypothetical protein DRI22_02455 [Caldisericota bacterium]
MEKIIEETLISGSKFIFQKNSNFPSFSLFVLVPSGSIFETEDTNGYSHFIEHLVFKGTKRRSSLDIPREIEGIGGDMNAFTGSEFTGFYIRARDKHFDKASDVLFDILFNASFPEVEIEREKNVVIQEILSLEDSPDELSIIELKKAMWSGSPFSFKVIGEDSVIKNATRDKLINFYRSFYNPEKIVISVYGNLEFGRVKSILEEKINKRGKNFRLNSSPKPPEFKRGISVKWKDTKQVHVSIGFPFPSLVSPNYYSSLLYTVILGGGMSSRLYSRIREELGLVYSIYTFTLSYKDTGAGVIYFATSKENVGKVVDEIKAILTRIVKEGVKEDEIERGKEYLIGNSLLKLESSLSRSERNAVSYYRRGYVEIFDEVIKKLQSVTYDEIMMEAEKVNFDNVSFGVCGDISYDEFKRLL